MRELELLELAKLCRAYVKLTFLEGELCKVFELVNSLLPAAKSNLLALDEPSKADAEVNCLGCSTCSNNVNSENDVDRLSS